MDTPRTYKCGLPPLLLFPPDPSEDSPSNQQRWDSQVKEKELMDSANKRTQWLLQRLGVYIHSLEDCEIDVKDLLLGHTSNDITLSVFELNRIASALENSSLQHSSFNEYLERTEPNDVNIDETKYLHLFKRSDGSNASDWESLLAHPLENAASEILALYRPEDVKRDDIDVYLQYQTAETLRFIQHMTLPSFKHTLHEQQYQLNEMRTTQKEIEQKYSAAFERLDDYCMNVLKVESDTLPLCPLNKNDDVAMSAFVGDIGKSVAGPLRVELDALIERFSKRLFGSALDISKAIDYYRSFTQFVSQQQADGTDDEQLKTLQKFIASNDIAKSIEQLGTSDTLMTLVSDLRLLDVFLSCRRKDISGSSSRGVGHVVSEAIDLEWNQFSTEQNVRSYDIDRFKHVTRDMLQQILGDSSQAKRLRLLYDAVGYSRNQEASGQLKLLCLKAANFARDMTLLDDQVKELSSVITKHTATMNAVKQEVKIMENRVKCINEGLKSVNWYK